MQYCNLEFWWLEDVVYLILILLICGITGRGSDPKKKKKGNTRTQRRNSVGGNKRDEIVELGCASCASERERESKATKHLILRKCWGVLSLFRFASIRKSPLFCLFPHVSIFLSLVLCLWSIYRFSLSAFQLTPFFFTPPFQILTFPINSLKPFRNRFVFRYCGRSHAPAHLPLFGTIQPKILIL